MDFEKIKPIELMQRAILAQSGGFQARAVSATRPKWDDMINNYPNSSVDVITLYNEIGNGLYEMLQKNSAWENTCAFRMSKGLNYSGFKLPYNNFKYRATGTSGGVHIGKDKLNYWYRVRELATYLIDHLGSPEIDIKLDKLQIPNALKKNTGLTLFEWQQIKTNKNKISDIDWKRLKTIKGIITFDVSGWNDASGHFTLWDGKNLIYPGGPEHDDPTNDKYYFSMIYPIKKKNGDLDLVQTNRVRIWELK
ncbi:Type VI secretion system (T6SS), amidase effector protein 4 [Flavobacterium sp. CF108]|uniref:T6SS effector amidase Tae4 family protein n=1 Tax=unclassified Flavobacterium TaxID=196869 RepID=UPI0008AC3882|nr:MULTISPECIES: T6SS effector amidase Tae4 family protein [unclassified Flavobacterium]SEO85532.1 Type VI secretion system (T6SS), amidase effector protein 4 [Flavobacterium sp. fv08]SHG69793.1 Type VI secretion system (T6SS), amidase effector protein 4 [Flavobacterium sp. CF108]